MQRARFDSQWVSSEECDSWLLQGQVIIATVSNFFFNQQLPQTLTEAIHQSQYISHSGLQGMLSMEAKSTGEKEQAQQFLVTRLSHPQNVSIIIRPHIT